MNTSVVFIHTLSNWSFGLSYILEATFSAINNVYYIT